MCVSGYAYLCRWRLTAGNDVLLKSVRCFPLSLVPGFPGLPPVKMQSIVGNVRWQTRGYMGSGALWEPGLS